MRNHVMRYRSLACAATLLLPLCSSSFAQPCSQATVRGIWGWQAHGTAMMTAPDGTTVMPVPFASLGIMNVDYQGRYIAHGTITVAGQVQEADVPGVMQVNPDCTVTDTYATGADRLVILDHGKEMQMIATTHPLGPVAATAQFRRIASSQWGPPCTPAMVRGVYAGLREGTLYTSIPGQPGPVPLPFSALVEMTVAPGGTATAASTASIGGTIVDFEMPDVSLQVNPDCTATMDWSGYPKGFPEQTSTGTVKYIVLDNGNELMHMDIQSSAGPSVVIGNVKKISTLPFASGQ